MSNSRVLSISTLYPNSHTPRFGTFVARSLEALAARDGWDVTVINPLGVPPLAFGKYKPLVHAAQDGIEHGVDVRRPTFTLIPNIGTRINPGVIARKILPLVERLHADSPFDLVDAQFFYPDGPAAVWIAKQLGLPCSIKARGSDITFWGHKSFALEQMLPAAEDAQGLLAVSEALARDMAALGLPYEKITLHYTGLDRDLFRPLEHEGLRSTLGQTLGITLPENRPLLVSVGALIERKGQDLTIGTLANFPDAQLLLVGKGPDEKHLRNLARDMRVEDRVHFLGSVDHDQLPVILSAADMMVLPSAAEGLANAWVESLACGTPIVIADAGGARELLTSTDGGVIVERSLESVTAGIRQILENPRATQLVTAAVAQFSWKQNAANLAHYYESLIGD